MRHRRTSLFSFSERANQTRFPTPKGGNLYPTLLSTRQRSRPWRNETPEPTQPQTDRDSKPARPARKENRDRKPRHPSLRPSKKGAPERNAPEPRTQLDRPAAARRRLDRTVGVGDRKQKRARTDAARTAGLSRTSDFLHCCIVAIAFTNPNGGRGRPSLLAGAFAPTMGGQPTSRAMREKNK